MTKFFVLVCELLELVHGIHSKLEVAEMLKCNINRSYCVAFSLQRNTTVVHVHVNGGC